MVHSKLISEGRVQPLTYSQLARIERIDARKARKEKELEVAREAVSQAGSLGSSALTALAAFATGPGGYVLGLAAIHVLEKILHSQVTDSPAGPTGWYIYDVTKNHAIAGPFSSANAAYASSDWSVLGQIHNLTGELYDVRNVPAFPAVTHQEGILSTDEAELAKSLLTTAAASGVAGNLLGGLFGRK